jgi:serine phosphatase RsbU (regulator of sigma subunit)
MPAALIMTSLQAWVQATAESPGDPAEVVARLNRGMIATSLGSRFITFFFCILDPRTGVLTYCNAGHNPPLLVRAGGGVTRLEGGGPVLGIFPALVFERRSCRLEPDDLLLLYSDGVTEAWNPQGEDFGEERLATLVTECRAEPAGTILRRVHAAVEEWVAGMPAADDITLVVARRTG